MSNDSIDIVVIDDEPQIRRLLGIILKNSQYRVHQAESGEKGMQEVVRIQPSMVILDLGLPDMAGIEVLRSLRAWSSVPVLVLSVMSEEATKVAALDAGADDYLIKPFGRDELLARLRALQRRVKPAAAASVFNSGELEIDFTHRIVRVRGQALDLTPMEYRLLQYMVGHRGKVVTHRQILRELWGPKSEAQTHYLRTYVLRLRQKIEANPEAPLFLKTVSGVGYRFAEAG